jgi:hypothetical protein
VRKSLALLAGGLLLAGSARAGAFRAVRFTAPAEGVVRISAGQLAGWGMAGRAYVYTGGRGIDYVRTRGGLEVYVAPYASRYDLERSFVVANRPLPYPGSSAPLRAGRGGEGFARYGRFFKRPRPPIAVPGPDSYVHTVHVEEDQIYIGGLTGGREDEDHWFYSTFLMPGRSLELPVELPGPLAGGDVRLTVALRGGTDVAGVAPDHRVEVRFNGQMVGEMLWNGYVRLESTFQLPAGLAAAGVNTVTLSGAAAPGVPFDLALADWVEVSYSRRLAAAADAFRAAIDAGPGRRLTVAGFSGPEVIAFDVTDPARPELLELTAAPADGAWSASWITLRGGERHYVLAGPAGRLAGGGPRSADPLEARRRGGHRYLIVSHADHLAPAARLAALHGGRRGRVRVYDVRDVYDAFACGQQVPAAIRALVRHHAPGHLCLVGDSSGDMRGLLGDPGSGLVPSFLVQGPHFQEASDNLFGCLDGDEYPEVAVGRLPCRTPAEAEAMIDKVEARLAAGGSYGGAPTSLVVGDDDQRIFVEGAAEMAGMLSWGGARTVMFSDYASPGEIRAEILSGWAESPEFFVYYGHAATTYLGKGKVLRNADVPELAAERLPAGVILGCMAGHFNFTAGNDSLAERMVKEPGRGVSGLVCPSGMSAPEGQLLLGRELARALRDHPGMSLGQALVAAKRRLPAAHLDVVRSFNLLGDPKLR